MSARLRCVLVSVFAILAVTSAAFAQSKTTKAVQPVVAEAATAPPVATAAPAVVASSTATASTVLVTLFACGVMGLVGQACRMIVGLSCLGVYKASAVPNNQDVFNLARLLFSLIVGFVAGFVAGMVQWRSPGIESIHVGDFNAMLKFAIAGYIGTDVIEAFTTRFFEPAHNQGPAPVPRT